jgi:gamma-glutamyl hercynylcysteine S-oxide synthase
VSTTLTRPLTADLRAELEDARARTLLLVSALSDRDLEVQHDPLMSPIIWDLGHIASFEELWLIKQLDAPVEFGEMPGLYNPFEHPRRERGDLPLPRRAEVLAHLARVREEVLQRLDSIDFDSGSPLLRDGYVYRMVAQHEHQHNETMLQTL